MLGERSEVRECGEEGRHQHIFCRLSWGEYVRQLLHFLAVIPKFPEREKTLVKLVVEIIQNFHFTINTRRVDVEAITARQREDREKAAAKRKKRKRRNPDGNNRR